MSPTMALIRINLRLAFREKAVLFFNYIFPLVFFFGFAQAFKAGSSGITQIVTMVLLIGVLGNGLFGAGLRAVVEREQNILRRYKVAPITPTPLLVSSMVVGWLLYLPAVALMLSLAHGIYGMSFPEQWPSLFLLLSLGAIAFRAIGLIIASVVNSMAESNILVQLFYMPMLFLSGATFPMSMLPDWAQIVAQFLPASYLLAGMQGIMIRQESITANLQAAVALVIAAALGLFISVKLFRWEKTDKIKNSGKLWLLAVFLPFLILGVYQAKSRENIAKSKLIQHDLRRSHARLIRGGRVIAGDGRVIENATLLIRAGKIEQIWEGQAPSPESLRVDPLEAAGKTVMPGLIDAHVHLGGPGGFLENPADYQKYVDMKRNLASYLYSGITAVRSVGDLVDSALEVRKQVNEGQYSGAELFTCGPLFTVAGGHGTEIFKNAPEQYRKIAEEQFLRLPKTADEAHHMVKDLKTKGVDCVKGVLEAGAGGMVFQRMDASILKAVVEEAHQQGLPVVIHTGDAQDAKDVVAMGADGVEHGSMRDAIPDALFAEMARRGMTYDPTMSVVEGISDFANGRLDLLNRSLTQQVTPPQLLESTRKMIESRNLAEMQQHIGKYPLVRATAEDNLKRAYAANVMLITGSDAGNPLVFHGPTVHREMQLWVQAGLPAAVAIQAATSNGAKALRRGDRMGLIRKGYDATLIVVDGNPLQDIFATERISNVLLNGELIDRGELFDQK